MVARTRPPYAPEFRRQMVELVRAGRDPESLAREFEPSAPAIRNWAAAAGQQEGQRSSKPTTAGFLYLAVVLDAWSGKIVGWSMANHLRTELVLDALEMALGQRRPGEVVLHSDQGSQFTSLAFGNRCREAGVRPSMGSVGDAYDNAMCESFFASLESELLARRRFTSQAEARMAGRTHARPGLSPLSRNWPS